MKSTLNDFSQVVFLRFNRNMASDVSRNGDKKPMGYKTQQEASTKPKHGWKTTHLKMKRRGKKEKE